MGKQQNHQFTQHQQTLVALKKDLGNLLGHGHHHHHHSNVKFQPPKQLTYNLALYALKKLNVLDPNFLTIKQKRLLEPVAPGIITNVIYAASHFLIGGYGIYIFRGLGAKALVSKAVFPLIGLYAGSKVLMIAVNELRQLLYYFERRNLVSHFKKQYGEKFLLESLNPKFRMPDL